MIFFLETKFFIYLRFDLFFFIENNFWVFRPRQLDYLVLQTLFLAFDRRDPMSTYSLDTYLSGENKTQF